MQPNRTIRDQVTDQIRNDVVSGKFASGQPLREREIAKKLGVSHGPVRDAFLQLSQEGFLTYQANRGVTVRHPPGNENQEFIISLRRQIEFFVLHRGFHYLSEEENLKHIEAALQDLKVACSAGDIALIAQTDMAFHQTILEICGGADFLLIWKWLCSQMLLVYSRLEDYMQVYEEHVAIFEGLRSGKKKAAITALKFNIR